MAYIVLMVEQQSSMKRQKHGKLTSVAKFINEGNKESMQGFEIISKLFSEKFSIAENTFWFAREISFNNSSLVVTAHDIALKILHNSHCNSSISAIQRDC